MSDAEGGSNAATTRSVVIRVSRRSDADWEPEEGLSPISSLRNYTASSMSTKAGRRRGMRTPTPKRSNRGGAIDVPALRPTSLADYHPHESKSHHSASRSNSHSSSTQSMKLKRSKRTSEVRRSTSMNRPRSPSSFVPKPRSSTSHSSRRLAKGRSSASKYATDECVDLDAGVRVTDHTGKKVRLKALQDALPEPSHRSTAATGSGDTAAPKVITSAGFGFDGFGGMAAMSDDKHASSSSKHFTPSSHSPRRQQRRRSHSSVSARSGGSGRSGASSSRSKKKKKAQSSAARKRWKKGMHAVTAMRQFDASGAQWRQSQKMVRDRVLGEMRAPVDNLRSGDLCTSLLRMFRDCGVTVERWFGGYDSPGIVKPYLLIGDKYDSKDKANLLRMGVTHILNVAKQVENAFPMSFIYKKIAMVDSPDQDPAKHFSSAIKFIDDARNNGGVCFVHCVAGVSRAAVIVLAYLLKRCHMPLRVAWERVKYVRPIIHPNERFRLALAKFEMSLFEGRSSVADFHHELWNFFAWNKIKKGVPRARLPKRYPCCCGLLSCCSCCECGPPYP